jgi:hypothetical protein
MRILKNESTGPMKSRKFAGWLLGVVCALILTGCGPKVVTVTGTVLNNGQPLTIGPTGSILVTLVPDVPPGTPYTTYPGDADATGKFQMREVPPGKYKVAVEQNDPLPASDKLAGKFSPKNTTIVREVVDEKTPLMIDLAKP